MPLTEKQKADIIKQVRRIVVEKHINVANPNYDYDAWAGAVDDKTAELVRAGDEGFEAGIRQLLVLLGSSHTGFYRKNGDVPAPHSIHATVSATQEAGRDVWMFSTSSMMAPHFRPVFALAICSLRWMGHRLCHQSRPFLNSEAGIV